MGDQICLQLSRKGERKYSPLVSFSLHWESTVVVAGNYLYSLIQRQHFPHEHIVLHNGRDLHRSSCLIARHPFLTLVVYYMLVIAVIRPRLTSQVANQLLFMVITQFPHYKFI